MVYSIDKAAFGSLFSCSLSVTVVLLFDSVIPILCLTLIHAALNVCSQHGISLIPVVSRFHVVDAVSTFLFIVAKVFILGCTARSDVVSMQISTLQVVFTWKTLL